LELKSACGTTKYCGSKPDSTSHGAYIFTSCTNTLTINYVSDIPTPNNFRGFNIYYESSIADAASALVIKEACTGDYFSFSCDSTDATKFTPYVSESFFGIQATTAQGCKYV
jgi:hypothetical protein